MRCVNNAMINPPRREVIAGIGTCTCSVPFFLLCACQAYCQDLTFWEYRFGVMKGIKVIVFSFFSTMIGWYTESSTGRASLVHASHNNYLCLGWLHIPLEVNYDTVLDVSLITMSSALYLDLGDSISELTLYPRHILERAMAN